MSNILLRYHCLDCGAHAARWLSREPWWPGTVALDHDGYCARCFRRHRAERPLADDAWWERRAHIEEALLQRFVRRVEQGEKPRAVLEDIGFEPVTAGPMTSAYIEWRQAEASKRRRHDAPRLEQGFREMLVSTDNGQLEGDERGFLERAADGVFVAQDVARESLLEAAVETYFSASPRPAIDWARARWSSRQDEWYGHYYVLRP
jgi:hypothetical protein